MVETALIEKTERFIDEIVKDEDNTLVKSKERVAAAGEVFTPRHIVRDMMNLEGVQEESYKLDSNFLEPSCGNGNFLIQILARKLMVVDKDHINTDVARAIASIYGVDIAPDNVVESRDRMMKAIEIYYNSLDMNLDDNLKKSFRYILNRNIILGDTLKNEMFEEKADKNDRLIYGNVAEFDWDSGRKKPMMISEWSIASNGAVVRKEIPMENIVKGENTNYSHVYGRVRLTQLAQQEDYFSSQEDLRNEL